MARVSRQAAGGSLLLEGPVEFGPLDCVPTETLLALPGARLFRLVTALDENPHTLRGFLELVSRVLAAPGASEMARQGLFTALRDGAIGEAARSIRAERRAQLAALRPGLADVPEHAVRSLLRAYVPSGLSEGRLLQYAASCTTSHTPFGLAIQRLQNFEMGYGTLQRQPAQGLRALCAAIGVDEIERLDFREDVSPDAEGLDDAIFERAVFIWALSAFPRIHLPELIGAALVQYAARLPPFLLALRDRVEAVGAATFSYFDVDSLDTATSPQLEAAIEAAERLLESVRDGARRAVTDRLVLGASVSWELTERWTRAMMSLVPDEPGGVAARVARIMASRRAVAAGFHRRVRLGPHSLEELLSPERFDARALLDALARSRYVVPGNAIASPLVREMVSLDGSMFRVFSDDEVAAISAWIDRLRPVDVDADERVGRSAATETSLWSTHRSEDGGPRSPEIDPCRWWEAASPVVETIRGYSALPARTVVRRILDIEKHPSARVFASYHLTRCLAKARSLLSPETSADIELSPDDPLTRDFFHLRRYTPETLEGLLAVQASLQKESHERWRKQRTLAPRDQVERDLAAGTPAALIDGAWLQYIAASEILHDASTTYLYRIYDDELGNGVERQHHGHIFRRLLDQAGIEHPDIVSSDFDACERSYSDANCVVALLWLCISLFPRRLRPETLGFNLAIESWGVGGAFRTSEATLRHHGLDPLFPRLHNLIDNYAEGHTGWAKQALHAYLAGAFRAGGDPLRQEMWERVWNGYALWSTRHQLRLEIERAAGQPETRSASELLSVP